MITHTIQMEFIRQIHQLRTPLLDAFFLFLNFFDRQEFFFILIPILWIGYGWKSGIRLFYILFFSYLTNHALKEFFASPRPFHLDPSLGLIQLHEYGFPSGAAQNAVLLSGLFLFHSKNKWKWAIVSAYVLLISFSRIYLGVHFPTDILAGWFVGLVLLAIVLYLFPFVEKGLQKLPLPFPFLLSQLIPLLLLFFFNSRNMLLLAPVAMGLSLGVQISFISRIIPLPPKNNKDFALKASIAVIGAFVCYGLSSLIPGSHSIIGLFTRSLFLALWLSLGCSILFRKI